MLHILTSVTTWHFSAALWFHLLQCPFDILRSFYETSQATHSSLVWVRYGTYFVISESNLTSTYATFAVVVVMHTRPIQDDFCHSESSWLIFLYYGWDVGMSHFLHTKPWIPGWWDIDIHGCYSLMKIAFAPICACKNNRRIWRHNTSILHSRDGKIVIHGNSCIILYIINCLNSFWLIDWFFIWGFHRSMAYQAGLLWLIKLVSLAYQAGLLFIQYTT